MKSVLPTKIGTYIVANDITLKSGMTIHCNKNELMKFFRVIFFQSILGYTETEYAVRIYASEKPVIFNESDEMHFKRHFYDESNVNGVRQATLYSF